MRWPAFFVVSASVSIAALFVATDGLYIVNESEQVIITRFGKPVGDSVTTPGLKFKIPLLHQANAIDMRLLDWDGGPNEMATKDRRFIVVDARADWRITDPLLFFQRVQHERGAMSLLDDIIDGETRNTVANFDLVEVVRSTSRELFYFSTSNEAAREIAAGRAALESEIRANASARTQELGIEIVDLRFERTNYPDFERQRVYKRMISDRQRIALEIRAEGEAEAARINRSKDRG